MKKRQEGYVLLYVLLAVLLMSLLAATVCSLALRGLKAQRTSTERLQAVYETEGLLERFAVELTQAPLTTSDETYSTEAEAERALRDALNERAEELLKKLNALGDAQLQMERAALTWEEAADGSVTVRLPLTASNAAHGIRIAAVLRVPLAPALNEEPIYGAPTIADDGSEVPNIIGTRYGCTAPLGDAAYESYETAPDASGETPPVEPVDPDEPDKPVAPDEPDEPVEPDKPVEPDEPDEPIDPDKPDDPDEPDEPVEPTEPDEPESAVIHFTIVGGKTVCTVQGRVKVAVGDTLADAVTFTRDESVTSRAFGQLKNSVRSNLVSADTSIALHQSLNVTGVRAGETTLVYEAFGITIPVVVY